MPAISELLQQAAALQDISDTARLDVELLLCHALKRDRSYLYTWPEASVSDSAAADFQRLFSRRVAGEPLAYILGHQEFWSLSLAVAPSTLIPRADTETLVEFALDLEAGTLATVLDLGTGTGAIALALASERPHWQVTGVDLSAEAVALAKLNAKRLNIANCTFYQSDWFAEISDQRFDLIVSNPPYIDPADPHLAQGDVRFEPRSALVAEENGLADLRTIADKARDHLTDKGWLAMEHGFEQAAAVRKLLQVLGYQSIASARDLAQRERITFGRWRSTDWNTKHG